VVASLTTRDNGQQHPAFSDPAKQERQAGMSDRLSEEREREIRARLIRLQWVTAQMNAFYDGGAVPAGEVYDLHLEREALEKALGDYSEELLAELDTVRRENASLREAFAVLNRAIKVIAVYGDERPEDYLASIGAMPERFKSDDLLKRLRMMDYEIAEHAFNAMLDVLRKYKVAGLEV
jgi:hypothetical protein